MAHSGRFDDLKGKCSVSKFAEERSLWETSLYLKFKFGKLLGTLDMATTTTPLICRGGARRIVLAGKEEQKQRLQINDYLPRCGKGETLKILMDERLGD